MKISRFEELEIWQIARELYRLVLKVSSREPFCKDYRLRDQMRASSGSISDNIAEGFDRGGNKEFHQFLSIAKGSCGELRNQSYRAFDSDYITPEELEEFLTKTNILSGKTSKLMKYLKSSSNKGIKYN